MTVDRERARQAADAVETALNREDGEPGLPTNLAAEYRAAVTILRDAADPATPESDAENALDLALRQLRTPPMIFLPATLTRDLESVRFQIARARQGYSHPSGLAATTALGTATHDDRGHRRPGRRDQLRD